MLKEPPTTFDYTFAAYWSAGPSPSTLGHTAESSTNRPETLFSVWELMLAAFDS